MKKYTLVTGATSGIGLSVVKKLSLTANVIVHGRDEAKLINVINNLEGEHLIFCCDFSSIETVADSLKVLLKNHGAVINKIVHCSGVDETLPTKLVNHKKVNDVMKVNFYSIVEILSVLLKKSVNHGSLKNILFVSSISSVRGFKGKASYSASKSALDSYMRVLSKELAPLCTVNSILPGAVHTPMSADVFKSEKMLSHFKEIYPLGIGSVEQIIEVISFYHDSDNSWVTGQQIVVDGGLIS